MALRIYTVHTRPPAPGEDHDVAFVPDGFSWFAFVLTPLFALWHRQWLLLAAYGVALAALTAAEQALAVHDAVQALLNFALSLFIGFHAHDWRRWRLAARGYRLAAVVAGRDLEEAEHRFFANWRFSRPTDTPFGLRPMSTVGVPMS